MKTILSIVLALAVNQIALAADDTHKPMDPKQQEMMKKFMEYSTPSDGHKVLAQMAGKWKATSSMWESENAKPETSTGTGTFKMVLGGRYLQQEFKGKAMGMPFEGMGYVGYNNLTKKYESTWMDNFATGTMHGEGTFDDTTKTLTDKGTFTCPVSKNPTQNYRTEWKILDKDTTTFTMFAPDRDSGKEYKNMEIAYKRVK